MSKIGRKPIFFKNVDIKVLDNVVFYSGPHHVGEYKVHDSLTVRKDADSLILAPVESELVGNKDINMIWGLHRALLNNAIQGSSSLFEKHIKIEGLGFKADVVMSNTVKNGITVNTINSIVFSLGFSHKIDFAVPADVTVEVDKTKQNIVLKSYDKHLVGKVASEIRALRPVEPYKGKGIFYKDEVLIRKAGKTK